MTVPPDWVQNLAEPVLSIGKRVLAVEGIRDSQIYTEWLRKLAPAGTLADDRVVVVSTGGKGALLSGLKWFRDEGGNPGDVYGLRDRDEWDAARIAFEAANLPQLRVNPLRHCLESYFCDPDEIEAALLGIDPAKSAPRLINLRAQIGAQLQNWSDHWSLWTTTNRLNAEMRGAKFPHFFHAQYKLPADADSKATGRLGGNRRTELGIRSIRLLTTDNPPSNHRRTTTLMRHGEELFSNGSASTGTSIHRSVGSY
jgi:hypothetical protein